MSVRLGMKPVLSSQFSVFAFRLSVLSSQWPACASLFHHCHPERARIERSEMSASRRTLRFVHTHTLLLPNVFAWKGHAFRPAVISKTDSRSSLTTDS